MAHAAMRRRRHQPDRIQNRAAADGDDEGMAVDVVLEQLALHVLDEMQLHLDLLAARHRDRIGNEAHAVRVAPGIGAEVVGQAGTRRQHALVDEHQAAVATVGLQPRQRVRQHRVVGRQQAGGEHDGKLVADGKALQMGQRLGGPGIRLDLRKILGHDCLLLDRGDPPARGQW
jgi:hypothetical protein